MSMSPSSQVSLECDRSLGCTDNEKGVECEGLEFRVHKTGGGRPRLDTRQALQEICGSEAQDTWCYISGPGGFIAGAEQACNDIKGLTYFAARWD